jgi:hypothetical protein
MVSRYRIDANIDCEHGFRRQTLPLLSGATVMFELLVIDMTNLGGILVLAILVSAAFLFVCGMACALKGK